MGKVVTALNENKDNLAGKIQDATNSLENQKRSGIANGI